MMKPAYFFTALFLSLTAILATTDSPAEIFKPFDEPEQQFEERDFWDNGQPKEYRKLDDQGRILGKAQYRNDGVLYKLEKFDKEGHKIAEAKFDGEGKLDDSLDGWAAKRWIYQDGKLVYETYYGEDDKVKERVFYDQYGSIIGRQFVGDNSMDPNEEFSRKVAGGQIIQYLSEDGRTVESQARSWQ